MDFDSLFLYGGEPLLCMDTIRKIASETDKQLWLETNGLLLPKHIEELLRINIRPFVSLDSFDYEINCRCRPMRPNEFNDLVSVIKEYKLDIINNIYAGLRGTKEFYNTCKQLGIKCDTYPVITPQNCEDVSCIEELPIDVLVFLGRHQTPHTRPKLRLHVDGYVSRIFDPGSMRISHISKWEPRMESLGELPYPKSCESCEVFGKCMFLSYFCYWAWIYDQMGILHASFGCKASKAIYRRRFDV
jgi:hypothetical protein